jgi:hypothetical protein
VGLLQNGGDLVAGQVAYVVCWWNVSIPDDIDDSIRKQEAWAREKFNRAGPQPEYKLRRRIYTAPKSRYIGFVWEAVCGE